MARFFLPFAFVSIVAFVFGRVTTDGLYSLGGQRAFIVMAIRESSGGLREDRPRAKDDLFRAGLLAG